MMKKLLTVIFTLSITAMAISQSIGLIGSSTPNGWDSDTDMVQDVDSAHLWTLSITLVEGAAKFRQDDDWATNWGGATFPFGVGEQDGADIPVLAGDYNITFNSNTGDYYFEIVSPIGLIGTSTPFDWDKDVNLFPDSVVADQWHITMDLEMGVAKFRQDDDWIVNWGSMDFPSGTGVQGGDDIPVPKAGNYTIVFNSASGEYTFTENVTFTTVGIIGDATPGGSTPTPMIEDPSAAGAWSLSLELADGGLEFSGNDGEVIWGGTDFPMGTASVGGGMIPVTAGKWQISFSTETGEYEFIPIQIFNTIGIIGDATPDGWDSDTDMERSETDSSEWSLRVILTDGVAKFRAEDDWAVNWGSAEFPTGVGVQGGADIPITAGEYIITFNSITGAYNFKELIIYNSIGLIGTATSFGDWDNEEEMTKDGTDENFWKIQSVALQDGEAKFRAEDDWIVNWGSEDFPGGVGTQDGSNILITAGTYGVTLNSGTGEYAFGEPLAAHELLNPSQILAFPNPTADVINIDISNTRIHGELELLVYDVKGQLLISNVQNAEAILQIDASQLVNGNYFLQIRNEKYLVGKRFSVAR